MMGVTSTSFPASGNVMVAKDVLMIDVIEGSIKGRQSLITRTGIFSMPGALCVAIVLTVASTCLFSTAYKVNCSDVA